jgi:hypothetical protein
MEQTKSVFDRVVRHRFFGPVGSGAVDVDAAVGMGVVGSCDELAYMGEGLVGCMRSYIHRHRDS